jgi:hypothetical protein
MTLSPLLSTIFLAAAGLVFLWMAWRGLATGELRAGSSGFRVYRPRRDESPAAFWFFVLLYVAFGIWLIAYGVRIATGDAAPLPLR